MRFPRTIMRRLAASFGLVLAFAACANWLLPLGRSAFELVASRDDPARIADARLAATLTPDNLAQDIESALAGGDTELAASFVALADDRGLAVDPAVRARVADESAQAHSMLATALSAGHGFLTGEVDGGASLAGSAAGDLIGWGDVRDLTREGYHAATGVPVDPLVVGLAGVGLAATAATFGSGLVLAPMRAGLTTFKVARRAGVMGAGFVGDVARLLREARPALPVAAEGADIARIGAKTGAKAGATAGAAGRSLVRMAGDLGMVQAKAGTRATLQGIKVLDSAGDTTRLARLAEKKGPATLAILTKLGRGALFLSEMAMKLGFLIIAALVNLVGLVAALNRFIVEMVRPLWRRRRAGFAAAVPGLGPAGLP
ncbi:hypothetical protein MWN34_16855 [Ancylobacter sp. 6x-1]|uniref:Uncharacterized protein n=1 Tax=Ancylobacter crimeensis TaxID=2579147 RepID=A0ABT0DFR7_9HYPH|nr:hypothetical protein [Ancylobacter crimeensis]MCK0198572.1 hypothetical protein [Ancylobacter crimeensis]